MKRGQSFWVVLILTHILSQQKLHYTNYLLYYGHAINAVPPIEMNGSHVENRILGLIIDKVYDDSIYCR